MMALQILVILQVIIILISPISCYPIYGTKRYGRSSASSVHHQWNTPSYQMLRTQRYPMNYYDLYPYYNQNYPDDYYYYYNTQDNLPMYYPIPRTSKYEVYQAVLPYYYYYDRPVTSTTRPNNYYYDNDPVVNLQEELLEEDEQQQQQQPIGHELFYENEDDNYNTDNIDDVNAAFLQNLIMSQMYNDDNYYGKWEDTPTNNRNLKPSYLQEDEDVRELKQLAKPQQHNEMDDIYWYQRLRNQKGEKRADNGQKLKIFTDRKPIIKPTTVPTTTIKTIVSKSGGQKEEVLMRPATPVKHPFSEPVLEMITNKNRIDNNIDEEKERKRTPSVYDTIKHMLDMEKNLETKYGGIDEIRPQMKKRIISSEDSLTQQLSVLKKSQ